MLKSLSLSNKVLSYLSLFLFLLLPLLLLFLVVVVITANEICTESVIDFQTNKIPIIIIFPSGVRQRGTPSSSNSVGPGP